MSPGSTGFRLRRRARKVALTARGLASVGWFGIAVMVAFCGIAAETTNDPTLAHGMYRSMQTVPWLSIPVGLLAGGAGALLGLGTNYGLVRYWWVVAKIPIAAALIATDAVLVTAVARNATVTGQPTPAL
jgi:hypothetical protein